MDKALDFGPKNVGSTPTKCKCKCKKFNTGKKLAYFERLK